MQRMERAHAVAGARVQRGEQAGGARGVAIAHHGVSGAILIQPIPLFHEQLEEVRLKKLKLRTKDQMLEIMSRYKAGHVM